MTCARSHGDDNGGRCELCNRPGSAYEQQSTYRVLLGGGLGWGTMWLCSKCRALTEERDKGLEPGMGKFTAEQLARLAAIGPGF